MPGVFFPILEGVDKGDRLENRVICKPDHLAVGELFLGSLKEVYQTRLTLLKRDWIGMFGSQGAAASVRAS